jgi:hypothetical protein
MINKTVRYLHLATAAYSVLAKRSSRLTFVLNPMRSKNAQPGSHQLVGVVRGLTPLDIIDLSKNDHTSHHSITPLRLSHHSSTKRYHSWGSGDSGNPKDKSFITRALDKIKSMVPFLKDEKQKKADIIRKQSADRVSSEIDRMFQDAPLGLRMIGKMMSPLIGSLAGGLVEAAREQSRQMDELLNECENLIAADYLARQELGDIIDIGSPFSQASSTVSVNGVTRKKIEAKFEVRGSKGGGVGILYASERGIDNLLVTVNGRTLNIDTSGRIRTEKSKSYLGKNKGKDDIIDAELVEKVKK